MAKGPSISFLFPYRWLVEDKEFLSANLIRKIQVYAGSEEESKALRKVTYYSIIIGIVSYRPVSVELTPKEVQKLLKPIMPNAKCMDVDIEFSQNRDKKSLPVIDFQIYL